MTLVQAVLAMDRFNRENTQEKVEVRVKAKAEKLFPENWRNEVAAAVIAQFAAQAKGF